MILAGDIGGTNTRLALYDGDTATWSESYPSKDHDGLPAVLDRALEQADPPRKIESATFGVAGPVRDGRSRTTNLPWIVDARELAAKLGLGRVGLINDLEAAAWGIDRLLPEELHTLHRGDPDPQGNRALISPGTGLGQAGLFNDGTTFHPFATEGGHADFAPGDEQQQRLLAYLRNEHGRVSWERVVSGPGLHAIYRFLKQEGTQDEPDWLREGLKDSDDPSATISAAAKRSPLAASALALFATLLAAEAGNLALKHLATAGVYIGGGIPPKILDELTKPTFVDAFRDKHPMRPLLDSIPLHVILAPDVALRGAARHAGAAREGLQRGDWKAEGQ